jgi:hypothetical protein
MYTNRICTVNSYQEKNKESKTIDLTIGIFFDGTCNNKYNIDWGAKKKVIDDSYSGTYTNVVLLWEAYKLNNINIEKIYIEGPGTYSPKSLDEKSSKDEIIIADNERRVSSQEEDSSRGSGFGSGDTGVHAKISRACSLIRTKIIGLYNKQKKPVKTLTIDVFGFSRGAASARCFVSNLLVFLDSYNAEYNICLRDHLKGSSIMKSSYFKKTIYDDMLKNIEIKVRFMGLFDTVSSYDRYISTSPNFKDDVHSLQLRIPFFLPTVKKVIHLVAADEYRENFALTDITSASKKGKEIILPGAHSDIGGGYKYQEVENIYMSDPIFNKSGKHKTGHRECRGYMSLQELIDENWLPLTWATPTYSWDRYGRIHSSHNSTRVVYNTYAKIPLYIMFSQAQKNSLEFNIEHIKTITFIDNKETSLINLRNMIIEKVAKRESLYSMIYTKNKKTGHIIRKYIKFTGSMNEKFLIDSVRFRFIHLSAHNERTWLFLRPHKATINNIREIISG